MFLSQRELENAPIVDDEGFVVGFIEKVEIKKNRLHLLTYEWKGEVKEIADIEALKHILLEECVPSKLFGRKSIGDLYKEIEKETGITEHEMIRSGPQYEHKVITDYAKLKGVEIPLKKVDTRRKIFGKPIPWDKVSAVGKTSQGACVLLNTPLKSKKSKSEQEELFTFDVENKMVIDASAKIIGFAKEVAFSAEEPALSLTRMTQVKEMEPDVKALRRSCVYEFESEKKMHRQIRRDLDLWEPAQITDDLFVSWARSTGREVPMKEKTRAFHEEFESVVTWSQIRKIGEVILLKKTVMIEEV